MGESIYSLHAELLKYRFELTYLKPPRVSKFSPQVCFWWLRSRNVLTNTTNNQWPPFRMFSNCAGPHLQLSCVTKPTGFLYALDPITPCLLVSPWYCIQAWNGWIDWTMIRNKSKIFTVLALWQKSPKHHTSSKRQNPDPATARSFSQKSPGNLKAILAVHKKESRSSQI